VGAAAAPGANPRAAPAPAAAANQPAPFRVSAADLARVDARTTADPPPPQAASPDPVRSAAGAEAAGAALPPGPRAFTCRRAGDGAGLDVPETVRVRVEPADKAILVEAAGTPEGGGDPIRYSLDQTFVAWFGGRNERDPRLGIVLSPSQGNLWLDVAAGEPGPVRPHRFDCRADGMTAARAP
jgi:hypothetical protein